MRFQQQIPMRVPRGILGSDSKDEAAGISRHALCRIQRELGVQTARRGGKWWWYGEAHANLFALKEPKENPTTITAPMTELCIVDFTVPGGVRILKLPPMT
jgi:hypothetical protein